MSTDEQQHIILGGGLSVVQPSVPVSIQTLPQGIRIRFCGKDSRRPGVTITVTHGKLMVTLNNGGAIGRNGLLSSKLMMIVLSEAEEWEVLDEPARPSTDD